MTESLHFEDVLNRPDLVSPSVFRIVTDWKGTNSKDEFRVALIDPKSANGTEFCDRYGFRHSEGANCVVIEGERGQVKTIAACVTPVGCRTDFNGTVRKFINARRVSLASLPYVLEASGMEYGSITPIGLPPSWLILIDSTVTQEPRLIIGSGIVRSKLSVPTAALAELQNAHIVEGLILS